MSYPSGSYLIAAIVEDCSLPPQVRIAAAKSCAMRAPLLRIIRNPNTPGKLKAVAALRYTELASIRQINKRG